MKKNWHVTYTIIVAALALLTPLFLRAMHPLIPGTESYVHYQGNAAYSLIVQLLSPLGDAIILLSLVLGIITVMLIFIYFF